MKIQSSQTMSVGVRLLRYWKEQKNVEVQTGLSRKNISSFEEINKILLPIDFRDYLAHANGFDQESGYQDKNGFNFWPTSRMCRVSEFDGGRFESHNPDSYFVFCDYLDFCWGYAICLSASCGENNVVMIGTKENIPLKVANNFLEFVDLYLVDDPCLYGNS